MRNCIVKTLMKRDDITEREAIEQMELVQDEFYDCLEADDFSGAMNACELIGLEIDYLEELF